LDFLLQLHVFYENSLLPLLDLNRADIAFHTFMAALIVRLYDFINLLQGRSISKVIGESPERSGACHHNGEGDADYFYNGRRSGLDLLLDGFQSFFLIGKDFDAVLEARAVLNDSLANVGLPSLQCV